MIDNFAPHTVLIAKKRFKADGPVYTYAAVKTPAGMWSLTGTEALLTWEQLEAKLYTRSDRSLVTLHVAEMGLSPVLVG